MGDIGSQVCRKALELISAPTGLSGAVAELSMEAGVTMTALSLASVRVENIAPELMEKSAGATYPSVHLYCERVTNSLREKFRRFSGKVRLAAEARVSQDGLDGLESRSRILADAITEVLDNSRGDWGQGMLYSGGYEVLYGPVKHGGKNFLQITKINFEVDVSR